MAIRFHDVILRVAYILNKYIIVGDIFKNGSYDRTSKGKIR